jgi:hypothetical protein
MTPDENLRKQCLELASRHETIPSEILKTAGRFEAFVKGGPRGTLVIDTTGIKITGNVPA